MADSTRVKESSENLRKIEMTMTELQKENAEMKKEIAEIKRPNDRSEMMLEKLFNHLSEVESFPRGKTISEETNKNANRCDGKIFLAKEALVEEVKDLKGCMWGNREWSQVWNEIEENNSEKVWLKSDTVPKIPFSDTDKLTEVKKSGQENLVIMSGEDKPRPLYHYEFEKDVYMKLIFKMGNGRKLQGEWEIGNGRKRSKTILVRNNSLRTLIMRDYYPGKHGRRGSYGDLLFTIPPGETIKIPRIVFTDALMKKMKSGQEIHVTIGEDKPRVGQRMLSFFRRLSCRDAAVSTVGAPAADACQAHQNGMTHSDQVISEPENSTPTNDLVIAPTDVSPPRPQSFSRNKILKKSRVPVEEAVLQEYGAPAEFKQGR